MMTRQATDVFPDVAELLPHDAPMIVIDGATGAGEDWVEAIATITPAHPLFETQDGGLPGWALIELMAQTIALFGGIRSHNNKEPVRIGYLLGTRKLVLNRTVFPAGEVLRIQAHCEFNDPEGLGAFYCTVKDAEGRLAADAKINVYQGNDGELS